MTSFASPGEAGIDDVVIGQLGGGEHAADLGSRRGKDFGIELKDRNLDAFASQRSRSRLAKGRRATRPLRGWGAVQSHVMRSKAGRPSQQTAAC